MRRTVHCEVGWMAPLSFTGAIFYMFYTFYTNIVFNSFCLVLVTNGVEILLTQLNVFVEPAAVVSWSLDSLFPGNYSYVVAWQYVPST